MEQKEQTTKRKQKGRPYLAPNPISQEMKDAIGIATKKLGVNEAMLVREALARFLLSYGITVEKLHPLHGGNRPAGSYFSPSVLSNSG